MPLLPQLAARPNFSFLNDSGSNLIYCRHITQRAPGDAVRQVQQLELQTPCAPPEFHVAASAHLTFCSQRALHTQVYKTYSNVRLYMSAAYLSQ